ncbi:MarR family transcriptional regulator [Paenibacillus sp. P96]|uniref:MarR family transcriptional regulator n=1 Tax=Paenibacillus zeirhizosphaerae TaxID=2987519 RepID=A0ABT9FLJ6_9BACL|nr:MarR family transcriptional regulator [Paenibacillus sp. P96]MDP4095609.1 MarR family transcriptional regulator [Paenibacillus sp. P96]
MPDTTTLLTQKSMHLHSVFAKSFKSISEHAVAGIKAAGFNPTAFAVMEVLYHKGAQPIQQIGAKLLLQSGNVTYVIDKLEDKGYLFRHPCPQDRRIIHAELTEEGRKIMDNIYPDYARQIDRAYSGMSQEEMEQLINLLKKLGRSAESLSSSTHK